MTAPGDSAGHGDRQHAASALVQLRRRVDAHFEAAVDRSPTQFSCRAGCHECCRRGLSVFAIEAVRIESALQRIPAVAREQVRAQAMRPNEALCPLLLDGLCSVYDERPIICRSHGLAVLPPAEARAARAMRGESDIDHCPLNYGSEQPPRASVLSLEAVNQPLSVMAQMWGETDRVLLVDLALGNDAPRR